MTAISAAADAAVADYSSLRFDFAVTGKPAVMMLVPAGQISYLGMSSEGLSADEVCAQLGIEPGSGLDAADVEKRRAQYGPNKLAEAEKEPGWHAFLRQYRDPMQIVLVAAGVISISTPSRPALRVMILCISSAW